MNNAIRGQTLSNARSRLNSPMCSKGMNFVVMSDETRNENPENIVERIPKGGFLIFRHYNHPERQALATDTVRACRKRRRLCLVSGDFEIARKARADGIHFPEYQLINRRYQKPLPTHWIKTAAAHNAQSIQLAQKLGFDAVMLSPVFATKSHPHVQPLGILNFAKICKSTQIPIFALGGVNGARINRIRAAGAVGGAGIGLFYDE